MPEAIRLITTVPRAVIEAMTGRHPDARHYSRIIGDADADVFRPDGSLLLALRVGRLSSADLRRALTPLLRMAKPTNKRPNAAGSNDVFRNNVGGFLHGEPVAFTNDPAFRSLRPLLRAMDEVFREARPDEYAVLARVAERIPIGLRPGGTVFTTVTANRDPTGVHHDSGNLDDGYGVMTAIRSRSFSGGLLVFPAFGIAVDLRPGAVLIADNKEAHGNTPFLGSRVSAVAYAHSSNLPS